METFGYVLLIIGLVLLFAFTAYEIYALIRDIVRRVRKHKDKTNKDESNTDNSVDSTGKGNE